MRLVQPQILSRPINHITSIILLASKRPKSNTPRQNSHVLHTATAEYRLIEFVVCSSKICTISNLCASCDDGQPNWDFFNVIFINQSLFASGMDPVEFPIVAFPYHVFLVQGATTGSFHKKCCDHSTTFVWLMADEKETIIPK